MIGVGERRGVAAGVNAGRGEVADGRGGVAVPAGTGTDAVVGVAWGAAVAVVCGAVALISTICPDSKIRPTFSLLISNSMLPFAGGGGGASCLPFSDIWTLSAKPR